ncbi:MAG: mandelate racemase/muconate lactonizing enzyme family protein [Planctomycetota bacterium]|jgi:muconate cycloisomerase|nr:mandelate racemase/muconate lactonizing enzyme family protein [Planctomycetota bacterium]MDP7132366.1 mandelate racemase/muconate lactonizing enzyme family protein [Planctomycetota bacterium]MDP7248823.1 mandelate racemase/muconate lactonizing enzyme family protein [Planctomycetota bacterium]
MKVTKVRTKVLALPNKEPYHYSHGSPLGCNCVLVEIETDEGIIGIGEACGDRSAEAVLGVVRAAARAIEGESPFNIEKFLYRFYRRGKWGDTRRFAHQALAGVEMALWDIMGKACGQPVHRLMGGMYHERISYFGFLQGHEPERLAEDAQMWRERGFDVLYLKVGISHERDLACVKAIRDAVGDDAKLRVDANQAWQVGEAIQLLHKMAPFNIDFAEQPVHWTNLDGMARIRAAVPIPIALDQGCFTEHEALAAIRKEAADVITVGHHEAGGLLGLKKVAAVAAAGGLPICRHGVMGETGISTLASLQVLATIPNQTDGNQVMHQLLEKDIVREGLLKFEDGHIAVPDRPGLGIELDEDQVERYSRLYEDKGPYHPF